MRGWTVSVRSPISAVISRKTRRPRRRRSARPVTDSEEPIDARRGAEPVARRGVVAQRGGDRRVQGHQPHPVELGVPDRDHALDEVDVGAGRAPSPRRCASRSPPAARAASDRSRPAAAAAAAAWRPAPRRSGRRVDVGRRPPPRDRQQPRRRDLVGGIEGVQVAGEAAHRAEPEVDGDRLDPLRQARPGDRQLDGDRRCPAGLEVGDEMGQHFAVAAELEAQRRDATAGSHRDDRPARSRCRPRRPGPRDRAQPLDIDPRVDRRW